MSRYAIEARDITKTMAFDIMSSALHRTLLTRGATISELVERSGLDKDRLRYYRLGTKAPHLWAFLRLVKALGPDFLNSITAPLGIAGAHWLEREDVCVLKLNGTLSRLVERIGAALEDGVICHREIAELVPVARRLHSTLGAFLLKYDNGNPASPERVRRAA